MPYEIEKDKLGIPDLKIAGLSIWVHGYEYVETDTEIDKNWLVITLRLEAAGTEVWIKGPYMETQNIDNFGFYCYGLLTGREKYAGLHPLEQEIRVNIYKDHRTGDLTLEVRLELDNAYQKHTARFAVDCYDVGRVMRQCGEIMEKFPTRNENLIA